MAALALNAQQAVAQSVKMRIGYRLTFIGDHVGVDVLNARVVDDAGRPVANARLAYRSADPAIAAVTPAGEVVARKAGSTKVWAVYGRDSASSLILVEQWASKFAFSPSTVRLDAIGAKQPLKVLVSDAGGVPVAGETSKTSPCRTVNDRIATLTSTGDVVAAGNGSTYIRCADKGIADSVKVDVQQRAVSASILNKSGLSRKSFGDTFSVRIQAKDRQGRDVVDARPTWASLNPAAVSVDPQSGKARAVSSGDAKIIVQIGDIADSTTISVTGGPVFAAPVATTAGADTASSTSKAGFSAQDLFMFEQDTASVQANATDSSGSPVQGARFRIRSADLTVAKLIDSARVVALKPGQSKLLVEYGGRIDSSKSVFVRQRSQAAGLDSSRAGGANDAFHDPAATFKDSVPKNTQQRDAVLKEILTDPRTAAGQRNLVFTVSGGGAIVEHLSHPTPDVTEDRTGVLSGGSGTLLLWRRLELSGTGRLGTLSTTGATGEPLTLTEAEGSLGLFIVPQVGLRLGYMLRTEKTTLATQKWTIPKVSLVTRFGFIGDLFNTYAAFSVLPKATFTGTPTESPSLFSRAGEAGLEFHTTHFNGGVTYYVEQFTFDNSPRVEAFSAIRFHLGLAKGW
jgi:hypothetical protein